MALFPHLDFEKKIQVNDKSRFNGSKSFVSKNESALTVMTIKPGADGSAINVFNADPLERFLDWEFAAFDIDIDATNNKLDFNEGGSELTATLSTNTYSLSDLATEIKTQMDSAGALTYTVTVSNKDKMTISAASNFSLLPTEGTNELVSILPIIGFKPKPGFGDHAFATEAELIGKRIRSLPKAITILVDTVAASSQSETIYIDVLSVAGDALMSNDYDLIKEKSDVLQFVRKGRNSYKDVHRRAQESILSYLDTNGFIDINGDKFTIDAFVDLEEFRQWSIFATLRLIYKDISDSIGDVFDSISSDYFALEKVKRKRAILSIDVDADGKADIGEGLKISTGGFIRS